MLFDIRTIVGSLIGVYGVILVITGLVSNSDSDLARSGGWNTNLWAGIGMIVVSVLFLAWAFLRPVKELVHKSDQSPGGTD
ncbi:drug/metabolite transporter (DMT)-like permease [Nocardia transvalensis]|uniref:Drug/metabolite transporter (DMT)-like permease n=1 Tax=Nocardia transvalensis TaxID=37333 RepID=A0A7W9P9U1_9NOCA|nr:membrane protein [Nocardia transvalensis]MBB5912065.1 drug/metabolite transporter (DMT)-like permease [Nocardia transvalensis]